MYLKIPKNAEFIINRLHDAGFDAYVVGGCVRDSLLGREPDDWDITTDASPEQVKKIFKRTVDTGIAHGTVTVLCKDGQYEVTTYRLDGDYSDHRHPSTVEFTKSLQEDLKRRDFTINAMAYNHSSGLIDLFGGVQDLDNKIIRCVGSAEERFEEDALRILRAFRFSAYLGFELEKDTLKAATDKAASLKYVSQERICAELIKLITSDQPGRLLEAYHAGVTAHILPEFDRMMETPQNSPHHLYSVGMHTLKCMENVMPDRILRLTMLLHDCGKPDASTVDDTGRQHFKMHNFVSEDIARSVLKRLKMDNETIKKVTLLIRYHDWHLIPDEENIRRLLSQIGTRMFLYLVLVQIADVQSQSDYKKDEKFARIIAEYDIFKRVAERGDCTSLKDMKLKGDDLKKLGVSPGPALGEILNRAFDEVLKDPDKNDHEYLVNFAENIIKNGEMI